VPAGKIEGDARSSLNNMMRGYAKRAVVIDLPGWMAVRYLDDAAHQYERDAKYPEQ
jgi:hypothetical protein